MQPGLAVAKACATDTTAEEFLELFKKTAAYEILSGRARGHRRIVSDGELLRCFRAFISLARHFCIDRGAEGPDVAELEVNPFAFRQQRMVPLDGRGRLATAAKRPPPRPIEKVRALLEPRSIAVLGVSSTAMNFGRIILNNIKDCGFPPEHLYVIKENEKAIDGVRCVPTSRDLPERSTCSSSPRRPPRCRRSSREVVASGKVGAAHHDPRRAGRNRRHRGDREADPRGHRRRARASRTAGRSSSARTAWASSRGPGATTRSSFRGEARHALVGPAAARRADLAERGVHRQPAEQPGDARPGAGRLARQPDRPDHGGPASQAVGERDDIDVHRRLRRGLRRHGRPGLRPRRPQRHRRRQDRGLLQGRPDAVGPLGGGRAHRVGRRRLRRMPGRRGERRRTGRRNVQGVRAARAIWRRRCTASRVRGLRLGAISNAGFETVGMADATIGPDYQVEIATLSDASKQRLVQVLAAHKLDKLVNARNPLDVTPMAADQAYEDCVRVLLESPDVDAVVASLVPLTPHMLTTAGRDQQARLAGRAAAEAVCGGGQAGGGEHRRGQSVRADGQGPAGGGRAGLPFGGPGGAGPRPLSVPAQCNGNRGARDAECARRLRAGRRSHRSGKREGVVRSSGSAPRSAKLQLCPP